MTIIGTESSIAWCPQTGTAPGTDNPPTTSSGSKLPALANPLWRWHYALNLEIAPQQLQAPLPMQVGGPLLPSGTYKGGAWAQGALQMFPRFSSDHLHWLLWSACSTYSLTHAEVPVSVAASPVAAWDYLYGGGDDLTGTYETDGVFTVDSTTGTARNNVNRYLGLKRLLPPDENGYYWGETISDARVSALVFEAGPGTPLRTTVGFVGRVPTLYDQTGTMHAGILMEEEWTPEYIASGWPGLPDGDVLTSCRGDLNLPTGSPLSLGAVDVTLAISPNMTTPMQERVLFNYYPEGYNILGWNIAVNLTIKKGVYELYDRIFFGGDHTAWSPAPWTSGDPFNIIFQSGTNSLATDTLPVEMEFYADTITWSMEPITTAAGQIVAARVTGIVQAPEDGFVGWYLRVRNGQDPAAIKVWPADA